MGAALSYGQTQNTTTRFMDAKVILTVLDQHALFAVLTPEEQHLLQKSASICKYNRHQPLFQPEDAANKVYFLLRGGIKVSVHTEKKDIIKYVVRPGNLFGESCLTGETRRRDFAHAMDEGAEVLEMEAHAVLTAMKLNFAFSQCFLHCLGERLRSTETQLESVVLKDSKSRIIDFLRQMGLDQGKKVGLETLVKHNMTHQDIADLTGTSRQMVTAVLNQLKRSNVLYFNRKKILFRDLGALPIAV